MSIRKVLRAALREAACCAGAGRAEGNMAIITAATAPCLLSVPSSASVASVTDRRSKQLRLTGDGSSYRGNSIHSGDDCGRFGETSLPPRYPLTHSSLLLPPSAISAHQCASVVLSSGDRSATSPPWPTGTASAKTPKYGKWRIWNSGNQETEGRNSDKP